MSIHLHSDYYRDNLEKRHCNSCIKTFIVGEELGKTVPAVRCPYCTSEDNEAVAWLNEDLGCLGIYFHKTENRYYDRCVMCRNVLTEDNVKHESLCISCHDGVKKRRSKASDTPAGNLEPKECRTCKHYRKSCLGGFVTYNCEVFGSLDTNQTERNPDITGATCPRWEAKEGVVKNGE